MESNLSQKQLNELKETLNELDLPFGLSDHLDDLDFHVEDGAIIIGVDLTKDDIHPDILTKLARQMAKTSLDDAEHAIHRIRVDSPIRRRDVMAIAQTLAAIPTPDVLNTDISPKEMIQLTILIEKLADIWKSASAALIREALENAS